MMHEVRCLNQQGNMEEGLQIRPINPDKTLTKLTVENKFIGQNIPLRLCPTKISEFQRQPQFY